MKSGIRMNFLERRVRADRALSQLVGMAREATATLSSREQRGVYRLESTWTEKSSAALPAPPVRIGSVVAARWAAFSTVLLLLIRALWAKVRVDSQKTVAGARAVWHGRLARIFIVRAAISGVRLVRQKLQRLVQRAHCHRLLFASRRKTG